LEPGRRISAMEAGRDMALYVILRALFGIEPGEEYDVMQARVKALMDGGHSPVATLMSLYVPPDVVRSIVYGRRDPQTMRLTANQGLFGLAARLPAVRAGQALLDALLDIIERRKERLDDGDMDALGVILRKALESGQEYDAASALAEALTLLLAGHD